MTKFLSHVWLALCAALVFTICLDEARAYTFVQPQHGKEVVPLYVAPETEWKLHQPGLMFLFDADGRMLGYAIASNTETEVDDRSTHPYMLVFIDQITGHAAYRLCESLAWCKEEGVRRWRDRREMGLELDLTTVAP